MAQDSSTEQVPPLANLGNSMAPYVMGVDIGGTNLRLALAGSRAEILGRWSASTKSLCDAETVVRLIRKGVDVLLAQAGLAPDSLSAVAAGAPGVTDADQGVVIATSYLMGWRNVPLRRMLEVEFGVPAFVDNDVNMAAIGERCAGAAQGASDFVFVAIGTGIGAGIVINGHVHRGSSWTAGEIGYMLVPGVSEASVEDGEPGALEGLAGGEGISAQWRSRWSYGLTALRQDATATEILDQAGTADPLAQDIFSHAATSLAYAIYNTSLILNCPLFVLGGGVGTHPALGDAIRSILEQRQAQVRPRLISSALGADAQIFGAIFQALKITKKGGPLRQTESIPHQLAKSTVALPVIVER